MSELAAPEVERAVLGGVRIVPERLTEVRRAVQAEDFSDPVHADIFKAIVAVADSGSNPDVRTVEAELRRRGRLEAAGGLAYLGGLDTSLPDAARVAEYAGPVAQRQLGGLDQRRKPRGIFDGQLGQYLAIHPAARDLQTVDQRR